MKLANVVFPFVANYFREHFSKEELDGYDAILDQAYRRALEQVYGDSEVSVNADDADKVVSLRQDFAISDYVHGITKEYIAILRAFKEHQRANTQNDFDGSGSIDRLKQLLTELNVKLSAEEVTSDEHSCMVQAFASLRGMLLRNYYDQLGRNLENSDVKTDPAREGEIEKMRVQVLADAANELNLVVDFSSVDQRDMGDEAGAERSLSITRAVAYANLSAVIQEQSARLKAKPAELNDAMEGDRASESDDGIQSVESLEGSEAEKFQPYSVDSIDRFGQAFEKAVMELPKYTAEDVKQVYTAHGTAGENKTLIKRQLLLMMYCQFNFARYLGELIKYGEIFEFWFDQAGTFSAGKYPGEKLFADFYDITVEAEELYASFGANRELLAEHFQDHSNVITNNIGIFYLKLAGLYHSMTLSPEHAADVDKNIEARNKALSQAMAMFKENIIRDGKQQFAVAPKYAAYVLLASHRVGIIADAELLVELAPCAEHFAKAIGMSANYDPTASYTTDNQKICAALLEMLHRLQCSHAERVHGHTSEESNRVSSAREEAQQLVMGNSGNPEVGMQDATVTPLVQLLSEAQGAAVTPLVRQGQGSDAKLLSPGIDEYSDADSNDGGLMRREETHVPDEGADVATSPNEGAEVATSPRRSPLRSLTNM